MLSQATIWELSIKLGLRKLTLTVPLAEAVRRALESGVQLLSIELADLYSVEFLANHHRDPFDRLLAVQALNHSLPIISRDKIFDAYGVQRIW